MKKIGWVTMIIVLLSIPTYAGAAPVLDKTIGVLGSSWFTYSFVVDPGTQYKVTLTDFEEAARFDYLSATITTGSYTLAKLSILPSSTNLSEFATFTADPKVETTYFASVLGDAANDPPGAGLFNINITAVPVPPALLLLGSGLFALFALRKRK